MACFPGLVRGAGSLAGSSAVRDASWFAWSRGRWKTKAMFYGPFRARPVIHDELQAPWFGQGLLTRPSSGTAGLPVPNRRRVTWRPSVGQTAGSGDPRRTRVPSVRTGR
jgi:hypothetical protein